MSFRGGNRGGGWRGGRGGSREAHKPPPAKKVRTEVRTHYKHVFTNPEISICNCFFNKEVVFLIKMSVIFAFCNEF